VGAALVFAAPRREGLTIVDLTPDQEKRIESALDSTPILYRLEWVGRDCRAVSALPEVRQALTRAYQAGLEDANRSEL
jgi:hypothetical protein